MVQTLNTNDGEDDFQSVSRKGVSKKRIYVGNLPTSIPESELVPKLLHVFQERVQCEIAESDVMLVSTKTCHAIVSCSGNVDTVIQKLNRTNFEGRRLVVQREHKRKDYTAKKTSFGGWSKPNHAKDDAPDPREEDIREIISSEMQLSNDPMGTAIASAAAVGVVTSVQMDETTAMDENEGSGKDFLSQPLSSLLSDYGQQDVNWKQVQPEREKTTCKEQSQQRLGQQGKAPIHVEFQSFGYRSGAPLRDGWSHAQPLPPIDCRNLNPVPQYLSWQDGLSGAVKHALLKSSHNGIEEESVGPDIRQLAHDTAEETASAVIDAIDKGGFGYALPLQMIIFVGSETGRHRSVVLCELAATAFRKLLRSNESNRFRQPCSVGTRHRDIQRRNTKVQNSSRAKQRDLEDD